MAIHKAVMRAEGGFNGSNEVGGESVIEGEGLRGGRTSACEQ